MKLSATVFVIVCVFAAAGKSHSETSRVSNILKVLSIAKTCVPWHNLKTDPTCPANETCVEVVGKPSTYECAKNVPLLKNESAIVSALFSTLNYKHQNKLAPGAIFRLKHAFDVAVPYLKNPTLSGAVSTSTDSIVGALPDQAHDIGYDEFVQIFVSVKTRDTKDFTVFLNTTNNIKALATGSPCRVYREADFCPTDNTCQLINGGINEQPLSYKGNLMFSTVFPKGFCKKDVAMTASERKDAVLWFHTLDKSNSGKLTPDELSILDANRGHFEVHLQNSIILSVNILASDTNHSGYVDFDEWIAGCTKLKNRDPEDFPTFLEFVHLLLPLKQGSRCSTDVWDVAKCPAGTTCRPSNAVDYCLPIIPKYEDCSRFEGCSKERPCEHYGACSPGDAKGFCKPDEYTCNRFPPSKSTTATTATTATATTAAATTTTTTTRTRVLPSGAVAVTTPLKTICFTLVLFLFSMYQ